MTRSGRGGLPVGKLVGLAVLLLVGYLAVIVATGMKGTVTESEVRKDVPLSVERQ